VADPRTRIVGDGYDVMGETFAAWREEIVGDPRREWEDELVSRLGHELRTPVTVILGMSQTLAERHVPDDQRQQLLARLVERSRDLARLVQRFEAAMEAGLTEWANVTAVASEVAAADPRIKVQAPATPAMASLNRIAAARILQELVDNALEFSATDREVRIHVSIAGDGPQVRVIDEGPGIEAELRERIFAPMEQGEDLNTRTHQGAGLGLTIAKRNIELNGGTIRVASERGHIIYRHAKMSAFIEADFADTPLARVNETPMSAGITFQSTAGEVLGQFRRALRGQGVKNFG